MPSHYVGRLPCACKKPTVRLFTLTSLLLAHPLSVSAETNSASDDQHLDTVIVTGTRDTTTTARKSSSPVTVISAQELEQTGQSNLIDALVRLEPSYEVPAHRSNLAQIIRAPRLRGLGGNQVLVLVNGKRRHASSHVNTWGEYTGSAGVDLEQIPFSAVERVEILKDGASAQYGSDAIAGVINIILKKKSEGGSIKVGVGSNSDSKANPDTNDKGFTRTVALNDGMKLGEEGFLNFSFEWKDKDYNNETGADPRVTSGSPYVGGIFGGPSSRQWISGFNTGYELDNGIELYGFGTFGKRDADSKQLYRVASRVPAVYPNGFVPVLNLDEQDYEFTFGANRPVLGNGTLDLSATYGVNEYETDINNTINFNLYQNTGDAQTSFDVGSHKYSQFMVNLDLVKPIEIGLLDQPLNFAAGLEARRLGYETKAGEVSAQYGGGPDAFGSLTDLDTVDASSNVFAGYLDLSAQLTSKWRVGAAARYEYYDDFGATINERLTTRYDFTPRFSLRGTISTGFRAPTLTEQYFASTLNSPSYAEVQLPVDSDAVSSVVGAKKLKPEKSKNISLGVVTEFITGWNASLDAYQIEIDDRIVNSSPIYGDIALAAISANGTVVNPGAEPAIMFFTNALDSRTRGVDLKVDHLTDLGGYGRIRWDLGASYTKNEILKLHDSPASLGDQPLVSALNRYQLTSLTPKTKIIASANYAIDEWTVNLRLTHYAKVTQLSNIGGSGATDYVNTAKARIITDLDVSRAFGPLTLTVGANNLFNLYPNKTIVESRRNGGNVYPSFSPYGINGGFYYASATYRF
ncbi:TonB-dependent receptor [Pseudomonas sp. D5002]|uniref:TonB-dependent receptor plug domain-containing protein n=1 Tax=Pseudomonas sp. D5002 TaxID=2738818 RepID=UPI0015A2A446|nr:TonB-dependent receptor [Pseudomonas sp. D5002]NWB09094.1 TonB-dependent receptor [Pseudomonas sp. D5002]